VSGALHVFVGGSALCRDTERLRAVLRDLHAAQYAIGRPVVVFTDDYPSGMGDLATRLCIQEGIGTEVFDGYTPQQALNYDARWALLVQRCGVECAVLGWYRHALDVPRLREALAERNAVVYEYTETLEQE